MTSIGVTAFPTRAQGALREPPSAVICGSFRRDREGLSWVYNSLQETGCRILSPLGIQFTAETDGFVFTEEEEGLDPAEIEARHLRAMRDADLVWLHAPDGYVGASAGLELGYAQALGLRVFSTTRPLESVYVPIVEVVSSVAAALEAFRDPLSNPATTNAPADSLGALQIYYRRAAATRGYDDESPRDCLLLITEEIGELARAVRKSAGLARDHSFSHDEDAAAEIADVQLYLVHLANLLGINLADAVIEKERVNTQRFLARLAEAA